jgi:hypothetical protein
VEFHKRYENRPVFKAIKIAVYYCVTITQARVCNGSSGFWSFSKLHSLQVFLVFEIVSVLKSSLCWKFLWCNNTNLGNLKQFFFWFQVFLYKFYVVATLKFQTKIDSKYKHSESVLHLFSIHFERISNLDKCEFVG